MTLAFVVKALLNKHQLCLFNFFKYYTDPTSSHPIMTINLMIVVTLQKKIMRAQVFTVVVELCSDYVLVHLY